MTTLVVPAFEIQKGFSKASTIRSFSHQSFMPRRVTGCIQSEAVVGPPEMNYRSRQNADPRNLNLSIVAWVEGVSLSFPSH